MATYSWTGPNDFTSDQQSPVLTDVAVSDAGTYTLTVTTEDGCADSASTDVIINPLPDCTITITPPQITSNSVHTVSVPEQTGAGYD